MKSKSRLIITGGTGYLGAHLLPLLSEKYQVTVIDRTIKRERVTVNDTGFIENNLADVTDDILSNTSVLIHAAYASDLAQEKSFIERILKLNPKLYIVYFSSAAVYGDLPDDLEAFTVEDSTLPVNDYGLYKLVLEYWIQDLTKKHLILRIANPYGKEFSCRGVYQIFRKLLLEQIESGAADLKLKINGDSPGEMVRDFIFIDDLVTRVSILISSKTRGICNVSSGQGLSLEDFAHNVLREILSGRNSNEKPRELSFQYQKDLNCREIKKSILR